ncbi:NADH:ubiquinone oxidoreductase 27 kD subunit [Thioflavicoccus mobilis 8321]|uniref:NADH:ubiquinone oxidoreductase 27 kD subunit n=1 Tax=Thioflavicoccus mobilis 8321 TaxID=765912 RepID=L0GZ57_9GAMM|nr:NADH-quinone oxidoreductase subunit C [Thioflavicoccus mobilis]AGA92028.1 NADH:ubiquinone oxidoreductase 27 kD subunit [Thioflavicoccus mobilis 8321]
MSLPEAFTEIGLDQWLETAKQHQAEGYRLVQMTGTARPEHFEIMVSYDKGLECRNYRVFVPKETPELPSISGIFAGAFTYENELKDLFGFAIPGLTIDYGGNFLRTKVKIPFAGAVTATKEPPAKAKAAAKPPAAEPAPTATPER